MSVLPIQAVIQRQNLVGQGRSQEILTTKPNGKWFFDSAGNSLVVPFTSTLDNFELLPAASVATGSDKFVTLLGSNTPVATQSTKGGLTLTSGATSTNQAGIAAVATTGFAAAISATNDLHARAQVNLKSLATMLASFGLNQTVTSVDPTANAGELLTFLADPTNSLTATTLATNAQALNWIIVGEVASVAYYGFTNVPLYAGEDVSLHVNIGPDLIGRYYINEQLVYTSLVAHTSGTTIKVIGGVETLASATAAMDMRYAFLSRACGM